MAQIYSTQFIAGNVGTGVPLEYTVPVGKVAVLRDIAAASDTSGNIIEAEVGGVRFWLEQFPAQGPGVSNSRNWTGRLVMNADQVLALVSVGSIGVVASGYLLATP